MNNKQLEYGIVLSAVVIVVAFFLPWVEMSDIVLMFTSSEMSLSGMDIISYITKFNRMLHDWTGESIPQLFLFYLLLLIPFTSAITIFFYMKNDKKKFKLFSILNGIIPFLLLLISYSVVSSDSDLEMVLDGISDIGIGGYLTLIASVATLVFYFMKSGKQTKETELDDEVRDGIKVESVEPKVEKEDVREKKVVLESDRNKTTTSKDALKEHISNIQRVGNNLFDGSKEELKKSSVLQIGFLVLAAFEFIFAILSMIDNEWLKAIECISIIAICIVLFMKLKFKMNSEVAIEIGKLLERWECFLRSLKLPRAFSDLSDKLVYLFIGIMLLNIFMPYAKVISVIIRMLATLSIYGLMGSILILLGDGKVKLAFNGLCGYLGVQVVILLNRAYEYRGLSFAVSTRILVYWILCWYSYRFIKGYLSEVKNEVEMDTKQVNIE